MANPYFDNSDAGLRFLPGETARGSDVDAKFDAVQAAFDSVAAVDDRALKIPVGDGAVPTTLPGADARKGRVLAFDATTGAPTQGPPIAQLGTVSAAVVAIGTVSDNIADVNSVAANMAGVLAAEGFAAAADNSADEAAAQAGLATAQVGLAAAQVALAGGHASTAAAQALLASQWADGSGEVAPGRYSAKHWADAASAVVIGGVIEDLAPRVDRAWSSEKTASEMGRGSGTSYTYTDGRLTGITETLPGGTRTTTLTYTAGVLTSMEVAFDGVTRTTTYNYTDGVLTGTTTTEV